MATKLEQANLNTQLDLLNDIVNHQNSINYEIEKQSSKGIEILKKRKFSEDGKTVELAADDFEAIWNILYIISDPVKWYKLGILSESAVPDMEMKKKILDKLKS